MASQPAASTGPNFNSIAQTFLKHYYTTFDAGDRSKLGPLYGDKSMLTFEGTTHQGAKAIIEKLTNLAFQKVAHNVKGMDAQPSGVGILIFVAGELKVDQETNAVKFSQSFHLTPTDASWKNFVVLNDIFRLVYG